TLPDANCQTQIANSPELASCVRIEPAAGPVNDRQSAFCNSCLAIPALIVLCAFLFFHRLADRDLWSSHEARAAQNAQSILTTGDWLMPRLFDLRPELQKPPLFYWLVAGVAQLTGGDVNAWAVRLPAAMAAAACVLVLFVLGKRLGHG